MSDEAENVVLRHLREMRAETKAGLEDVRSDIGLLRTETKAAVADVAGVTRKTLSEIGALAGRMDHIETELRLADRLAALEAQVAELRRRADS
jgi:DNA-binding XRE family transcriptional regulator